jgi:SSS family solute:Na+ symporter
LLCASTIIAKDIYQVYINPNVEDKTLIFIVRTSNMIIGFFSIIIALLKINLITLNLFAFALRSSGPFAAYIMGLSWKSATKHSGLVSIICGSVGAVIWQVLEDPFGILAIVFGCAAGIISFAVTVLIEKALGMEAAPGVYTADANEGKL